jgi:hypothetical protein
VKIIRHDGGADGFVTTTCFVPQLNLGITVLTNTDANSFYGALRRQIIDAYMNLPYQNFSAMIYKLSEPNMKAENDEIKKLKDTVAKRSKPAMKTEDYSGTYSNEVYGKITIVGPLPEINMPNKKIPAQAENTLTILFSHHPQLKGNLQPLGENDFLCTYSVPTYGIKKIHFNVENGKVKSVIVRVNDFVDMMEYEFVKD